MPLPVYVVNLDRRPDRWAFMSAQLDRLGIAATRIPAIDKETLTGDREPSRLGSGHIACAQSHYRAMQALVASHAPAALILEDDAQVSPAILSCLQSSDWWPAAHGLIQLVGDRGRGLRLLGKPVGTTPGGATLRPIMRREVIGCGYLIDDEAARAVLAVAPAVPMLLDHLLFDCRYSDLARRLRPLQMVPAPVRHPPDLKDSDTGPTYVAGWTIQRPSPAVRAWRRLSVAYEIFRGRAELVEVPYA